MVTVDLDVCTGCGICLRRFAGYCISSQSGRPSIDYSLCNQCQKCVAICPSQAFLMNNTKPLEIDGSADIPYNVLKEFLSQRRSIKKFQKKQIPESVLQQIAQAAAYAPNQNKNIDIVVINDPEILALIDGEALKFVGRLYRWLFSAGPVAWFMGLYKSARTIKKKMEYDLLHNQHILKENTAALFLAVGNPRVPVTEESAQYLLGTMILCAQALGIGTCLMDSIKISINHNSLAKRKLGIPGNAKVLGVLAAGYSSENIKNVPRGYEIHLHWNRMN